jgi:hypothetical protein
MESNKINGRLLYKTSLLADSSLSKEIYFDPLPSVDSVAFASTTGIVALESTSGITIEASADEEFPSIESSGISFGVIPRSSTSKVKVSLGPMELFPVSP